MAPGIAGRFRKKGAKSCPGPVGLTFRRVTTGGRDAGPGAGGGSRSAGASSGARCPGGGPGGIENNGATLMNARNFIRVAVAVALVGGMARAGDVDGPGRYRDVVGAYAAKSYNITFEGGVP